MGRHAPFRVIPATCLLLISVALPLQCREKDAVQYGMGVMVNVEAPESELLQAVEEVAKNGIIRGTKEYNKDEFVNGANFAASTRVFPQWTEAGTVFYKIRAHALDPRNFKESGDLGTLAVRYVVEKLGDNNCVLRIDAVFVEEFRHTVHPSNGSVETAEYKDIQDHLSAMQLMKKQAAEAEQERQTRVATKLQLGLSDGKSETGPAAGARKAASSSVNEVLPAAEALAGTSSSEPLDERVRDLHRQLERLVRIPGAPLKSAPFHSASTMKTLSGGTEVLILIVTPYWYGVETRNGEHGWMRRDEVEERQ